MLCIGLTVAFNTGIKHFYEKLKQYDAVTAFCRIVALNVWAFIDQPVLGFGVQRNLSPHSHIAVVTTPHQSDHC